MAYSTAPKIKVREWMQSRQNAREPKPQVDLRELKRQIGWELNEMERDKKVFRY